MQRFKAISEQDIAERDNISIALIFASLVVLAFVVGYLIGQDSGRSIMVQEGASRGVIEYGDKCGEWKWKD